LLLPTTTFLFGWLAGVAGGKYVERAVSRLNS
jgi:hypothetical protein